MGDAVNNIQRSGVFTEAQSFDFVPVLGSEILTNFAPNYTFTNVVSVTGGINGTNVLPFSGEFFQWDISNTSWLIAAFEFPGSPALAYVTLKPGSIVKTPFKSVRIAYVSGDASSGYLLRAIVGRGVFDVRHV